MSLDSEHDAFLVTAQLLPSSFPVSASSLLPFWSTGFSDVTLNELSYLPVGDDAGIEPFSGSGILKPVEGIFLVPRKSFSSAIARRRRSSAMSTSCPDFGAISSLRLDFGYSSVTDDVDSCSK